MGPRNAKPEGLRKFILTEETPNALCQNRFEIARTNHKIFGGAPDKLSIDFQMLFRYFVEEYPHNALGESRIIMTNMLADQEGGLMRLNRMFIFGVFFLCVVLYLSGCKREEISESSFIGTWANTATEGYSWKSITLNGDGTAELIYWNNNTAGPCTWKFDEEKLVVTDEANKTLIDLSYKFRGKTKLVLTGTAENVVMTGDGTYIKQ